MKLRKEWMPYTVIRKYRLRISSRNLKGDKRWGLEGKPEFFVGNRA